MKRRERGHRTELKVSGSIPRSIYVLVGLAGSKRATNPTTETLYKYGGETLTPAVLEK